MEVKGIKHRNFKNDAVLSKLFIFKLFPKSSFNQDRAHSKSYNMVNGYKMIDTIKLQAPGDATIMNDTSTVQISYKAVSDHWNPMNTDNSSISVISHLFSQFIQLPSYKKISNKMHMPR